MPSPSEVARRLARFKEEVLLKRPAPIISSPPKQRPPARRWPLPPRSSRIAAQPLAHIPASKRGEVLLQMKMGIPPPAPPISPASSAARQAIISRNLSEQQIVAFDEIFPAVRSVGRASRNATVEVA
jgi:hypothetical protein